MLFFLNTILAVYSEFTKSGGASFALTLLGHLLAGEICIDRPKQRFDASNHKKRDRIFIRSLCFSFPTDSLVR